MKTAGRRNGNLALALALLLASMGCSQSSRSTPTGSSSSQLAVQAEDAGVITTVSGYGGCTHPACADIARACDDIIRTGCGTPYLYGADGGLISTEKCTPDFDRGLASCTVSTWAELTDLIEAFGDREDDAGSSPVPVRSVVAAELARCTRRATNCEQRIACAKGTFIPPPMLFDAGAPLAPPPDAAGPPPTPPFIAGPGAPSVTHGAPWQDGGFPATDLIPGVDSPSCASCAIQRCPTFAYRCFSADYNSVDCPSGDCCHSLRKCILQCGGYSPQATMTQFVACTS